MDDHIGQFLHFMSVEKGASGNTISAYRNDLQQFRSFLESTRSGNNGHYWSAADRNVISQYLLELRGRNYAAATVARKVAAVKSFFQYLKEQGVVAENPTERVDSPRVGKALPKALTPAQVDELLEQPAKRDTPEARRDRAMLEVLYATGMRVTELVSLDMGHVHLDPVRPYVRCFGKGSKERTIPIYESAAQAVRAYLDEGRPHLIRNHREQALFVNRRGERLTRQGFWLILKQYARQAGIDYVTPHTLRHSFATHMLKGGMSLRHVQELLGHANISTTQVYTQLTTDHVRQVYEQAHPRAH